MSRYGSSAARTPCDLRDTLLGFCIEVCMYYSILSMTQLMQKIHSSRVVQESDAFDEGTSSDSCSDHNKKAAGLDEGDFRPVASVTETGNGEDVKDLEDDDE